MLQRNPHGMPLATGRCLAVAIAVAVALGLATAWPVAAAPAPQTAVGVRLGFPYLVGGTLRLPLGHTANLAVTGDVTPVGSVMLGRVSAQALFHSGYGSQPFFAVGPAWVFGGSIREVPSSGVGAISLSLGKEYRPPDGSMSYYGEAGLDLLFSAGNVYPTPRVAVGVNAYL